MDKELHKKPAKINRFNEKWLYMSLPFQSKNVDALFKQYVSARPSNTENSVADYSRPPYKISSMVLPETSSSERAPPIEAGASCFNVKVFNMQPLYMHKIIHTIHAPNYEFYSPASPRNKRTNILGSIYHI